MKVQVIFAVKTMSSVYFHHSHIQTNLIAHFWLCTGIACACVCVSLCVCVVKNCLCYRVTSKEPKTDSYLW